MNADDAKAWLIARATYDDRAADAAWVRLWAAGGPDRPAMSDDNIRFLLAAFDLAARIRLCPPDLAEEIGVTAVHPREWVRQVLQEAKDQGIEADRFDPSDAEAKLMAALGMIPVPSVENDDDLCLKMKLTKLILRQEDLAREELQGFLTAVEADASRFVLTYGEGGNPEDDAAAADGTDCAR